MTGPKRRTVYVLITTFLRYRFVGKFLVYAVTDVFDRTKARYYCCLSL